MLSHQGRKPTSEPPKDFYGLDTKPKPTNYRKAELIIAIDPIPTLVSKDDPDVEGITLLAEKDSEFCRRLQDDKAFHDVFWHRMLLSQRWTPAPQEIAIRDFVDESIKDRIELVLKQKLLLAKIFDSLDESDKKHLKSVANGKIIYMRQWMNLDMPNYSKILAKCLKSNT